jgi:hypothetical protein
MGTRKHAFGKGISTTSGVIYGNPQYLRGGLSIGARGDFCPPGGG